MDDVIAKPWTREEFEQQLRGKEKYYHSNHEFHVLMHSGQLDKSAIQGWVANRFYYQVAIPVKDAAIMSKCWDRDIRREWIKRIIDQSIEVVRDILVQRAKALEAITHRLMDVESIDADELKRLVEDNTESPRVVPGTEKTAEETPELAITPSEELSEPPDAASATASGGQSKPR